MHTSRPRRLASASPRAEVMTGSPGSENTGTSMRLPSVRSCSTAAGRWRSAPTSSGLRPCALNQRASLAARGGLARALEAGHQHDGRRAAGVGDLQRLAAEDAGQLAVDDLDDLLAGVEHLRSGGPDRLGADAGDDVAGDADVDVGLEQGGADLAQHLVDVGLGEPTLAAEAPDDAFEAVGQVLEHPPP